MVKGGGTRSSKNRSISRSLRVNANVVTYDADVDQVDIKEDDHLNNSDEAIIESDDDDDAGIPSITNKYSSDNDELLADEHKEINTLSSVRTKQTGRNNISSAERLLLAREAVFRFVHYYIAHVVDR